MTGEIHVWMPMIGFDRDQPDKGVGDLIERMSFTPTGVSAFLFHPDIVHQHTGLDQERVLPPDNCSYYGSPRNEDRSRQDWTNQDLKVLVGNLNDAGVEPYLGIMGSELGNRWHHEWISDHPEVRFQSRTFEWSVNVLKRLADGTYYEDFFVDKLCAALTEYGFAGLQVADSFCPSSSTLYNGDFSADMVNQFVRHTGAALPQDLAESMDDDSREVRNRRGDWIWLDHRQEWIEFHAWRWEGFWTKVCTRLHAIGKKVIVLGMYCTDPFETLYCKGVDLKRLVDAGVDYLMPNIVPTGLRLQHPDRPDRFHRYMTLAPLTAAFVPNGKLLSLLGVKDATEEWDVLHHAPCLLERDITTLLSFMRVTPEGLSPCLDGLMICLGDGIHAEEWAWLRKRFELASVEGVEQVLAPTLVWSDAALYNTLPEYIRTRRWTVHKLVYEMAERGALCPAVVRVEDLSAASGCLFVPNVDLLPDNEIAALASYGGGPVVCTAATASFNPQDYGIEVDTYIADVFSPNPMCVFAFNAPQLDGGDAASLAAPDEEVRAASGGETPEPEESTNTLVETLPFAQVSDGFCESCASLLRTLGNEVFTCNLPVVTMRMTDGHYRLIITNPELNSYGFAIVEATCPIKAVENVSTYPVLPIKFMNAADDSVGWLGSESDGTQRFFRAKVTPGGTTILDVTLHGPAEQQSGGQ